MRRLKTVVALAALTAGAAGAETFGVQVGAAAGGGLGLHLGAYSRVAGFGPLQAEGRGTLDLRRGGAEVGADALLSVNLLLARPYAGVGVGVPLSGGGSFGFHTTLGARFGLPGPFSGFAEGNFGSRNVYRAGLLLRF
ncbi:hypothetical protein DAERI_040149 [Deinococcus aerius]|uniref:Uncharacterized protein n=1 Tax=Deinococcus aerius TaxID=200253 RepID=A0A2I9CU80_9DEIO|nr:hypothetical protein [Deinococcus aerius]GBF05389.1 hypothetical protein DAERI_040149 [Deinococcus aerius]